MAADFETIDLSGEEFAQQRRRQEESRQEERRRASLAQERAQEEENARAAEAAAIEADYDDDLQRDAEGDDQEETASFEGGGSVKKGPRISFISGLLMLLAALAFDGIQILLDFAIIGFVLNTLIDIAAWLTFYIWFKWLGISFSGKGSGFGGSQSSLKNPLVAIAAGCFIEAIPGINALPAWTLSIVSALMFEYGTWLAGKTMVGKVAGFAAGGAAL